MGLHSHNLCGADEKVCGSGLCSTGWYFKPVSPIHYLDCDDEGDGVWEEGRGGGMFQDKLCLSVLRVLDVQRVDTDGTPVLSTVS